ncbi:MAG TPA: type II secretion system protein N [Steroidobacteraceae bacterium]|nr:type II secretion system protein N [Steroidobacteraceae bacterium]
MTFRTKLIITGICAYLLFLIATIPATMLFRFIRHQVQAGAVSGTLWHGKAGTLQAGVLNLGDAEWNLHVLPLFTGHVVADVKLTQPKGFAQSRVSVSFGGRIKLTRMSAALPFASIMGSGGLPGGWMGTAQIRMDELVLKNNWPVAAQGTVDAIDVTGPASGPTDIGNYRITFASGNGSSPLTGEIQDMDGAAISVRGKLVLNANRSYQLDTRVAARDNTPDAIADGMKYLGDPDAEGRRPFTVTGTM